MTIEYISHARTPEELKLEILSNLRWRIAQLDGYANVVAKNASEKARIARATAELQDMLVYWQALKIVRPLTKREQARQERAAQGISGSVTGTHIPPAKEA